MSLRGDEGTGNEGLPRLVLIADRFTEDQAAETVLEVVRAGVRWVHLRDHAAAKTAFERAAVGLVGRLREVDPTVQISVNTRIKVAHALGLGGHIGTRGPSVAEARAALPEALVGHSAHAMAEAQQAEADGAAYAFFSPIFPTASKPGHAGVGLDALRAICEVVTVPVFALGGITPDAVAACLDAGAYGVAVLSGILHAPDPTAAVRSYLAALR